MPSACMAVSVDKVEDAKRAEVLTVQCVPNMLAYMRYFGLPVQDNLTQSLSVEGPSAADDAAEEEDSSPFEKYDPLLHLGVGAGRRTRSKDIELLSVAFVKKYIQYAKSKPAPVLTKSAADWIVSVYANLRNEEMEKNTKRVSST